MKPLLRKGKGKMKSRRNQKYRTRKRGGGKDDPQSGKSQMSEQTAHEILGDGIFSVHELEEDPVLGPAPPAAAAAALPPAAAAAPPPPPDAAALPPPSPGLTEDDFAAFENEYDAAAAADAAQTRQMNAAQKRKFEREAAHAEWKKAYDESEPAYTKWKEENAEREKKALEKLTAVRARIKSLDDKYQSTRNTPGGFSRTKKYKRRRTRKRV